MRSRGLGRGLSALIGDSDEKGGGLSQVLISDVSPNPEQPRTNFNLENLEELQSSIADNGVLQPILIKPMDDGKYQIVAGERRWRASKMLGLAHIPAIVKDIDEVKTLELALIENVQREDLSALEEAESYKKLMSQYGYTQEALAVVVSKSRSHIGNLLRLLNLPGKIKDHLKDGSISLGHAKLLMNAPNSEEIVDLIIESELNVRDAERLIKSYKQKSSSSKSSGNKKQTDSKEGLEYDVQAIENALNASLGGQLQVKIDCHKEGTKVTLYCEDLEGLDLVVRKLTSSIE